MEMAEKAGGRISINRIRLEFKVQRIFTGAKFFPVLIESDWNLKKRNRCFEKN